MNDSDDKIIIDGSAATTGDTTSETPHAAPDQDSANAPARNDGFIGEVVGLSVKVVAVVLSIVIMLISILAMAYPLSAMRTFNDLGMSARALDFGEMYVSRRLKKGGAPDVSEIGFAVQTENERLPRMLSSDFCDSDFIEALDVGINLSYKLMQDSVAAGDKENTEYYARILENYTRMYGSISGIHQVYEAKDLTLYRKLTPAQRPYAYSYEHTLRTLNFRARTHLGETNNMLYNSNNIGDNVRATSTISQTFTGQHLSDYDTGTAAGKAQLAALIDRYVDYIDCLGAYISIEFDKLGVVGEVNEATANAKYHNIADGTEFDLFITREAGFTLLYNQLKGGTSFTSYAQAAVDFPTTNDEELLRKLYWMQSFTSVSTKLWYMSILLFTNRSRFGAQESAILNEYYSEPGKFGTCEGYMFVRRGGANVMIQELYGEYLAQYIK